MSYNPQEIIQRLRANQQKQQQNEVHSEEKVKKSSHPIVLNANVPNNLDNIQLQQLQQHEINQTQIDLQKKIEELEKQVFSQQKLLNDKNSNIKFLKNEINILQHQITENPGNGGNYYEHKTDLNEQIDKISIIKQLLLKNQDLVRPVLNIIVNDRDLD